MTIRQHLRWLVLLVVAATLSLSALGVLALQQELRGRARLEQSLQLTQLAYEIRLSALQHRRFEKDLFLNIADPAEREAYRKRLSEQAQLLRGHAGKLRAELRSGAERGRVDRVLELHRRYLAALEETLARDDASSPAELNRTFQPHKQTVYDLEREAQAVLDDSRAEQQAIRAALEEQGQRSLLALVVFALLSVALIAALLLRHARYIQNGLQAFAARIEDLASARRLLKEDLTWPRRDELGDIMSHMNGLLRTLRALYERVAEGERSLDVTIRALGDGLIAVDVEGRITRLNPVAESLTGCREQDVVGKPIEEVLELLDGQTRAALPVALRQVARDGIDADLPPGVLLRSRSGNERTIADSMRPIRSAEGQNLGAVMVFRDVTEQVAVEQRLRHAEKMDAVGRLAGGIAHDFNNLLTGILAGAEFLREQQLDEEGRRYVDTIERSAESAAQLSSKLVAFARAGDKLSTPVRVHRVLEDVVLLMRHSLDKMVEIGLVLDATNDLVVGDPSQIQNALLNLGINARDAMPRGGKLTFETACVPLPAAGELHADFSAGRAGPFLRVRVRDTGSGIAPEVLPRIFEPFFTTKGVGSGTGIGLASVYATVQDHGGAISVASRPGDTTFELFFPSHAATEVELPQPSPFSNRKSVSGRVLVVDDEEVLRRVARSILQRAGFEVLLADNGDEALRLLASESGVVAVLLDLVMPVLGGRECFERVRELYPKLPVVLTSGFSNATRVQELLDAGAAAFVSKPYRVADLIQVMQQVVTKSRTNHQ